MHVFPKQEQTSGSPYRENIKEEQIVTDSGAPVEKAIWILCSGHQYILALFVGSKKLCETERTQNIFEMFAVHRNCYCMCRERVGFLGLCPLKQKACMREE